MLPYPTRNFLTPSLKPATWYSRTELHAEEKSAVKASTIAGYGKDREIRISGLVLLWLLGLKEIGEGILEVKIQKNCGLAFHPFLSLPKLTLRVGFQI